MQLPEPDVDESLLVAALDSAGVRAEVVAWDDPNVVWSSYACAVLRSCWNYHEPDQQSAFQAWLTHADSSTLLLNPVQAVHWNFSKRYLLELQRAGITIAPTEIIPRGSTVVVPDDWERVVVKPLVSAGSRQTCVIDSWHDEVPEHVHQLVASEDVLVQQYVRSVDDHGERCLVWIRDTLMHAIRKEPRFAGQDERVSLSAVEISDQEAAFAHRVLDTAAACGGFSRSDLLYARVDLALDDSHAPLLMELELIEPSLFLMQSAATREACVAAITQAAFAYN